MIAFMKKSLTILGLVASLLPASTAFAAETESNHGARTAPTTDSNAAPRILELINRERAAAGLTSLTLDEEVTEIALGWSGKMARADRLSHNKAYLSPESLDRLNAATVGENVAFADSVDEIHSLLMESPPHRANILNADFRQVGVGAVRSPAGELYLTEDFLTRRAEPRRTGGPGPGATEEQPSGGERGAPAQPAKPAAPRRARPARPAASRPPVAQAARSAASRPPMGKAARRAVAARGPATEPLAPPTATAPLTPSAPLSPAAPPPASSQETLPPVAPVTPAPGEPTASPEVPSEAEASAEAAVPDALPVATPAFEGAADRRGPEKPAGDLVKGLPALVLFRRWLGRRR